MISRRSVLSALMAAPLAAILPVAVPAALAEDAVDLTRARELVQTVADTGIRDVLTASLPQAEKIHRFQGIFDTYFDMGSIARFVLAQYFRTATPEQQSRFAALFRDVNVYTWARRFKDYNGQKLVVANATADGNKGAYVDTRVEQANNQAPMIVRWRLRTREGAQFGLQVVDLEVEGVSMALTYRSEYSSILQANGGSLDGLNSQLETQVARLRAEQPG